MSEPLKLLSSATVDELSENIGKNLDRYITTNFHDAVRGNGWAIETTVAKWDPAIATKLDPTGGPEAEIKNSLLVYKGFQGMTPALAREERLWTRLCHVECLDYVRARWLSRGGNIPNLVRLHCFAVGLTGCRDDNAVGRLWWNGHVASLACPNDLELGLRRLLSRANIRMHVVERADTAFRQPLVSGIVRLLGAESWFDTFDAAVAIFMLEVNKRSGGTIFEALTEEQIDAHLARCLRLAQTQSAKAVEAA
ncbi:MAG: hypothetical protein JWR21_2883 [Herminiimonas sp.]|nr:hypothetical protein [Herminiimonas sp.]